MRGDERGTLSAVDWGVMEKSSEEVAEMAAANVLSALPANVSSHVTFQLSYSVCCIFFVLLAIFIVFILYFFIFFNDFFLLLPFTQRKISPPKKPVELDNVLRSEILRYNALLSTIRTTLQRLLHAQRGLVVLTSSLEVLRRDILLGVIPQEWRALSHPSSKPLALYLRDLRMRVAFVQAWTTQGTDFPYSLPKNSFINLYK